MPDLTRSGRRCAEGGFTMIAVVAVMTVLSLLAAGAYAAVTGDLRSGGYTQSQKQAYAAAEAGLSWYLAELLQDPNSWTNCANVPQVPGGTTGWTSAPVVDHVRVQGDPPPPWRAVGGTSDPNVTGPAYYVELKPVSGSSKCDPNNPIGTMIDPTNGTFQVQVTGRASPTGPHRTVRATFRRRGFLDFIYYTKYEEMDPSVFMPQSRVQSSNPDVVTWVAANCANRYWDGTPSAPGRSTASYTGAVTYTDGTGTKNYNSYNLCNDASIQFASFDTVAGPFHTEDSFLVCGTPTFGRSSTDRIESADSVTPYRKAGCGTDTPNFKGTWYPGANSMDLPPDNKALQKNVMPGYLFTGTTKIALSGTQMTVNNQTMGIVNQTMPIPANGVIYVTGSGCTTTYDPRNPYNAPQNCGDVYVSGTYQTNLTIGSEKDIVVNGTIKAGDSTSLLGLVANQFVRVQHLSCGDNSLAGLEIDAAILTVNDSFVVDSYGCGQLGQLTVKGAIAQRYRGVVGTSGNGSGYTGYQKSYSYDDRFRYRSPPSFLDPVRSSWQVVRLVEQVPAQP